MNEVRLCIVGGQRAGSTFLASLLNSHPDISIPYLELPLLEEPFYSGSDIKSFVAQLQEPAVVRGFKRPDSLSLPEGPQRAKCLGVERVIVSVRDPLERLWSAVHWMMYSRQMPIVEPEVIVNRALVEWSTQGDHEDPYHRLLSDGLFGEHCVRWAEAYGPNLFVVEAPLSLAGSLPRLLNWLEVDVVELSPGDGVQNSVVYDLRRLKFLSLRGRGGFSWRDARRLEDAIGFMRRRPIRASRNIAVHGVDRMVAKVSSRSQEKPRMSASMEGRLVEFYHEDQQLLRREGFVV